MEKNGKKLFKDESYRWDNSYNDEEVHNSYNDEPESMLAWLPIPTSNLFRLNIFSLLFNLFLTICLNWMSDTVSNLDRTKPEFQKIFINQFRDIPMVN